MFQTMVYNNKIKNKLPHYKGSVLQIYQISSDKINFIHYMDKSFESMTINYRVQFIRTFNLLQKRMIK